MRKIITFLVLAIFLISVVSAEILIQAQPKALYNIGDTVKIPVKITTLSGLQQTFSMHLICNNQQKDYFMNDINLLAGEEESFNPVLILTKAKVGGLNGDCVIKAVLGNDYVLTTEFYVSDFITIDFPMEKVEFNPGENILVQGTATKESGELVNGFIELSIVNELENINIVDTVSNGDFSINFSIPKTMPAKPYLAKIKVYEKDTTGEITNNGFVDYNLAIKQVPTNLEILFEESDVEPGTSMKVKTILHDQAGEAMKSTAIITVKDKNNQILTQEEKSTGEFLEYPISYKEPPAEWKIFAVSNQLTGEADFRIKEKEEIKAELINRTLIVTNVGNVPYNDTLSVKIGDKFVELPVSLGIDGVEKFVLTAPEGEYDVTVMSSKGEKKVSGSVMLTGDAIDIRKAAEGVVTIVRHPLVWIFVIAILGFVAFIFFKKGYQKSFIGYIRKIKPHKKESESYIISTPADNSKNKAELSLSIKGEKQNTSIVCVNVKNFIGVESQRDGAKKELQEIIQIAEEEKASTYENQENLFFILAPVNTRTFNNEKNALKIAQEIEKKLKEYNKLARQKIDFGISLNYGAIIAKKEKDVLKFMSMGTLITGAKKIASVANQEILLGEKIKEKLMSELKAEKQVRGNVRVYAIKDVKKEKESDKKFIGDFVRRNKQ